MFTRVEARHYRSLRFTNQVIEPFQVLIGPNAAGKSTFLDVLAFLGDLIRLGPEGAVRERTSNFKDLVWLRNGSRFELAVEAEIPEERRKSPAEKNFAAIRYEVAVALDESTQEIGIEHEKVLLKTRRPPERLNLSFFPVEELEVPTTLFVASSPQSRASVTKNPTGNDNFSSEIHAKSGKGWNPSFRLGPRRSALANLPADESEFPATVWLRNLLTEGVQTLSLNSQLLRRASAPGQGKQFRSDGSNLPWVLKQFSLDPERKVDWLDHIRTALPDIADVTVVERLDDHHAYIVVTYTNGAQVPSWSLSDGTLRLLALTLIGYLENFEGCYLIEEPENGIHPRAVETVIQSLSSCYSAQILSATHSPVVLSTIPVHQLLCFAKSASGATSTIAGAEHPMLREWREEANLSLLFAAGVLG